MIRCTSCHEDNPAKFRLCGYCGTPLPKAADAPPPAMPVREVRKTVTVIFCDLKGSTALGEQLDAEALHEVKEHYFQAMAAQIQRHGGTIEKYIGDAIMAVFGLPRAFEDDALRAVRAALGMQAALAQVNAELLERHGVELANRTGINTGEVVARDDADADQKLATGDAVNLAARLEQAAPPQQIYIGERTWRLVRDAVQVEPVEPLTLKGKSQPMPAYRLVSAEGQDGLVRRHDRPLVGREAELATLRSSYAQAAGGREVRTVTLIGDAGFGKSRLVHELIHRLARGARALSGRCLPYGDGITFWPLIMMLREAADIHDDDTPQVARTKLQATVGHAEVAARLSSVAGLSTAAYPLAEINWAARKFFESQAADSPLLIFADDIHWAEPAFLDLLRHVQQTARDAPLLIVATARRDLLEAHADWGTTAGTARIELQPLSPAAASLVVRNLLGKAGMPDEVMQRIVLAADGNPLFAEQMLSMLIDTGMLRLQDGQWQRTEALTDIAVPPTIQALLEARLDGLPRIERAAVEPASVIGLQFVQPALMAMVPQAMQAELAAPLEALMRKQFIRPLELAGEDMAYRFQHHLVRETVYNGLLKRVRAQLHLAFVRWADVANARSDRALEFEEILGYHLEQAHRNLRELGPLDTQGQDAGRDGARRLSGAGRRAMARGDVHAAASLLRRAVALLPVEDEARARVLPELAEALAGVGDFAGYRTTLDEAQAAAERLGDVRLEAAAALLGLMLSLYSGQVLPGWGDEALARCQALVPRLESEQAHAELAMAWRLVVQVHGAAGRYSLANEALSRTLHHAREAGNERLVARSALGLSQNALYGATAVPQAIALCQRILGDGLSDRQVACKLACNLAQLEAMQGQAEAARGRVDEARASLRDLGAGVYASSTGIDLARVALAGDDPQWAYADVRSECDYLAAKGETYFYSTMTALLGFIARERGSAEEALALSQASQKASADDDAESQALWRMVRAPLLADAAAAEALAREALDLAHRTESPVLQADAWRELAGVLARGGQAAAARLAAEEALKRYEAKGHLAAVRRTHALLAQLGN